MVGFEKVGKQRVPFGVQCKYAKCTIQTMLKILSAGGKLGFISPARSLTETMYHKILRPTIKLRKQYICFHCVFS
jgi:hypothetical protein